MKNHRSLAAYQSHTMRGRRRGVGARAPNTLNAQKTDTHAHKHTHTHSCHREGLNHTR